MKNCGIDAYKNILFRVLCRGMYGESEFLEARKRLEGVLENDLKWNSAMVHVSCGKTAVSSKEHKRAQKRLEK